MTPTEESVVLDAGIRYFDHPAEFRARVEALFINEQPASANESIAERGSTPLSQEDRGFAAFLAVARIMADFRRQVDAVTHE